MAIFINLLTISRMALGALIFILLTRTEMYWIAFVLFFIASTTDYFDGYLARKYNHVSKIGEILDPIADKILIVFLLFAISVNLTSYYIAFASAFIITREIWVGALRDFNARQNKTDATKVTFLAIIQIGRVEKFLNFLIDNNLIKLLKSQFFPATSFLSSLTV